MTSGDEDTPVIGVDGGGSHCRLALRVGAEVIEVHTESCNLSTNFSSGISELKRGIDALSQASGRAVLSIPAYFALAGVVSDEIAARAEAALPMRNLRVREDRLAAIRGALGAADGVVLHAGTGSFVGIQQRGATRFAGGWGARLGDEGSGFWLGREVLRLRLAVAEGRAEPGALTRWIDAEIGAAAEVIHFAGTSSVREVAALARRVVECAPHDPAAVRMLVNCAAYLSDIAWDIGMTPGMPVCLTGGLGPHLAPYLAAGIQANLHRPKGTPLEGALSLAEELENAR
ncbi:glucosamine kinase nucleotide-binding domain-containing protein [Roseivivax sp. CAU 1753]